MSITAREPVDQGANALLEVSDLTITFPGDAEQKRVVSGVSYAIAPGRTLGVVGESGCGKTMTALALMGLVPPPGTTTGSVRFNGNELIGQAERRWRDLRGARLAIVFQEPMSSLNPVMPVGRQIAEVIVLHEKLGWRAAGERAIDLMAAVGVPSPRERASAYPHELSGGLRQRAMIAMALACRPDLLIADEPTTALDATIQAQILDLFLDLQDEFRMAVQFISHNLAIVSEIADEIIVMYAGRIVERAPADLIFDAPRHPYTRGLLETLPDPARRKARLPVIPGVVPDDRRALTGCSFADRCTLAEARCRAETPAFGMIAPRHHVACFRAEA